MPNSIFQYELKSFLFEDLLVWHLRHLPNLELSEGKMHKLPIPSKFTPFPVCTKGQGVIELDCAKDASMSPLVTLYEVISRDAT